MTKKQKNRFILGLVGFVVIVGIVILWLHAQTTPSKTITPDSLVFEFLGENIPSTAIDDSQFCNVKDGADFCLVLNGFSCESFIKTIEFCCEVTENFNPESTYDHFQSKFSLLNDYPYEDCNNSICLFAGCEYTKGHIFFQTTYEDHHPIYVFEIKKDNIQKLVVCSSLPYFLRQ